MPRQTWTMRCEGLATLAVLLIAGCTVSPSPSPTARPTPSAVPTSVHSGQPTVAESIGPGDCGGVSRVRCEAAVSAAQLGLFPAPGQVVVSWRVVPTAVVVCDGVIQPKLDVTFALRNPAGSITVTIGELPNGELAACSY
jgi:hypothetical protein